MSSVAEYNHDTWDDVAKYVKRKAKNRLDERIQEKRRKLKNSVLTPDGTVEIKEEDDVKETAEMSDHESDIYLSDDDLKRGKNSNLFLNHIDVKIFKFGFAQILLRRESRKTKRKMTPKRNFLKMLLQLKSTRRFIR